MNPADLNWDDLKYVVSVADAGSVSGAARRLGVNHATVLRRIASIESAVDHRLFDREATGYSPTPWGEYVVSCAQRVRQELQALEQQLAPNDNELEGHVRLTTTDSLLITVVGPALRSFQREHPRISVELIVSNQILSLDERHADIAIRPTRNVPDKVSAHRVCELGFSIYASKALLAEIPGAPNRESRWLAINESEPSPTHYWMKTHWPDAQIVLRTDSFATLTQLVEQGHGLAVLPCCLGDHSSQLQRIGDLLPELETTLWVIAPSDLDGVARVNRLCQHLLNEMISQQHLISGNRID